MLTSDDTSRGGWQNGETEGKSGKLRSVTSKVRQLCHSHDYFYYQFTAVVRKNGLK